MRKIKHNIKKIKRIISPKKKEQLKRKIGAPPGTVIHVGDKKNEQAVITLIEYDENIFNHYVIDSHEELMKIKGRGNQKTVQWIDFNGFGDIDNLKKFGEIFEIHPLILEDIANSNHQPKIDYYDEDIFLVLKKINWEENKDISYDQISILLTANFLFTFRDDVGEDFPKILQRIESGKNVFRKSRSDYLFYVLVDYTIDHYFLVLEELSERIETMQEKLLEKPDQSDLHQIQILKKEAYTLKQIIRPTREAISNIIRLESNYISKKNLIYFRDSFDHIMQLYESIEIQRESITTLIDIYLSSLSNRMNEVMKFLTLIATIFIPLTFIAGIYGMNFSNMPELSWKYGYFIVLAVMALMGIFLLFFFKRKKWL